MAIAIVPDYLGQDFSTASPGLRFGLYLKLWDKDPKTDTVKQSKNNKGSALKAVTVLTDNDKATLRALLARQQHIFSQASDQSNRQVFEATAIAPFSTGLGNEHPLENGFAFLNPYGLPYLPGSGVKGVLREAARELAKGEWGDSDWTDEAIRVLFGSDDDQNALRGALVFLDVIPQIKDNSLAVEIMTPHQTHYYQEGKSPHDSGQPVPILFLAVPEGSEFVFHVQCNQRLLVQHAPELAHNNAWHSLLTAAFEHAFAWLGFGAKTAVGYGAMREDEKKRKIRDTQLKQQQEEERIKFERQQRQQAIATMNPVDKAIAECLDARTDKNQQEISVLITGLKDGRWDQDLAKGVAVQLKLKMQGEKKWKEKSEKKNPDKDKDYQNTLIIQRYLL